MLSCLARLVISPHRVVASSRRLAKSRKSHGTLLQPPTLRPRGADRTAHRLRDKSTHQRDNHLPCKNCGNRSQHLPESIHLRSVQPRLLSRTPKSHNRRNGNNTQDAPRERTTSHCDPWRQRILPDTTLPTSLALH